MKKAFTLVELIVVITILAILGTIAFLSFQGYSKTARDSRRISDINNIKTALGLFILNTGKYPIPDNGNEVYYSGDLLWTQGTIGDNVTTNLSKTLQKKPLDPLLDIEYIYSATFSQKEYQVMALYEGNLSLNNTNLINTPYAADTTYNTKVEGTYNEVFVKTDNFIVPTPSIINAEVNSGGLILNSNNILSQVTTGGTNVPKLNIPNTAIQTGGLDINLSVYTGSITKNSTNQDKVNVINAIQNAYSGTLLANSSGYKLILNTTNNYDKLELLNAIVLKTDEKIQMSTCASQPNYTHTNFIEGLPLVDNTAWQNTNNSQPCYYSCTGGYTGNDCSIPLVCNSGEDTTTGVCKDPYLSNVAVLMHMDGANGATNYTDEKGHTFVNHGNAKISNTQNKFGGTSLYINGSNGYIDITTNDLILGNQPFTMEFWVFVNELPGAGYGYPLISYGNGTEGAGGFATEMFYGNAGWGYTKYFIIRNAYGNLTGAPEGVSTGQWYHTAIQRDTIDGNIRISKNGVFGPYLTTTTNFGTVNHLKLGLYSGARLLNGNMYLDDIRITKGAARYSGDFTPPIQAFPNQ